MTTLRTPLTYLGEFCAQIALVTIVLTLRIAAVMVGIVIVAPFTYTHALDLFALMGSVPDVASLHLPSVIPAMASAIVPLAVLMTLEEKLVDIQEKA